MAERNRQGQPDHIWIRLEIPVELHSKIRTLAKENGSTIGKQLLELLETSVQEPSVIESQIGYFKPDAQDIQMNRSGSIISVTWNSIEERSRIIYDTSTQEFFGKLPLNGAESQSTDSN